MLTFSVNSILVSTIPLNTNLTVQVKELANAKIRLLIQTNGCYKSAIDGQYIRRYEVHFLTDSFMYRLKQTVAI